MRPRSKHISNLAKSAGAQLLRLVPGSAALRLKRDLRDAALLPRADAVVVSFPKSGRTFVRAMLAHLYQQRFGIDERALLEFGVFRHAPAEAPRVFFTHAGDAMRPPSEIGVDAAAYSQARVILIARHPGDIAVSRYHHLKHRSRDKARRRLADQPLERFVWSPQGGIPSIVTFLNQFAALPAVTILKYEDFAREPRLALRQLADAIGLDFADSEIAGAAEFGALANLKELERQGYFRSARLRLKKAGDAESGKVRKGRSGDYRLQLGEMEADRIDAYVSEHLNPVFGYSAQANARAGP